MYTQPGGDPAADPTLTESLYLSSGLGTPLNPPRYAGRRDLELVLLPFGSVEWTTYFLMLMI